MRAWMVWLPAGGVLCGVALSACGSDAPAGDCGGQFCSAPDAGDPDTYDPLGTGNAKLTGITVEPANATIEILNDVIVTQTFSAVSHFSDGSSKAVAAESWTANMPNVGAISGNGLYTPSAVAGGPVTITANYKGNKGTATLGVKLHYTQNPSNVSATVQGKLKAASTPDATIVWAYPYNKTVFPRGLGSTPLMWNNGQPADQYYVHVVSPFYELETFTIAAPPSRFTLAEADWTKFVDSTSGAADLFVNRFDGNTATQVMHHTWTIAPASMRGTVYYWANNLGRVMRIKPGATQPDDFLSAGGVTGCSTCHAVSADGSTLVIGGDVATSTFDLKANKPSFSGMGRAWAQPALSPDGKYLVQNASPLPGPPGGSDGLWLTANGQRVPASGLDGFHFGMPAFSPDGSSLVYRDEAAGPTPGSLRAFDFDPKLGKASNDHELVKPGANAAIATISFPTVSPDGKWIVYGRGNTIDTRFGTSDLYITSTSAANSEVRLAQANGDGYPFAAGARDLGWNFEPTFAPVAAGGYFWFVMTDRRTYGNQLIAGKDSTKQLWVVAIDQVPQLGKDPSHPAFRLPGQAIDSLNMRGFWALDPCKQDGSSCSSGTECCGGYCDPSPDGGPPVCGPKQGCSNNGDKCDVSADCCGSSSGSTCINHVCSEPTPN